MSNVSRIPAVMLCLFTVVAGCGSSTQVKRDRIYTDPSMPKPEHLEVGTAVGGVVLAPGVRLHHSPELPAAGLDRLGQADFWSANLEFALRRGGVVLDPMPHWKFADEYAGQEIGRILDLYAARRTLPPEMMQVIAGDRGAPRYMILVRIEGDHVAPGSDMTAPGLGDIPIVGGHAPDRPTMNETLENVDSTWPVVWRTVLVTVDVFDLQRGFSVNTIQVEASKKGKSAPPTPDYKVRILGEEDDGRAAFYVKDDPFAEAAPEFEVLLDECLQKAVHDLLGEPPVETLR